jgi:hypothetical protein
MVCRCGVFYWANAATKSGMETENLLGSSIKPKSSCRALSTSVKMPPGRSSTAQEDEQKIYEQISNHDRGGRNSCRTAFGAGRSGDSKTGMLNNGGIVEAIRKRREGDVHPGEDTRSRSYCLLLLLVARL